MLRVRLRRGPTALGAAHEERPVDDALRLEARHCVPQVRRAYTRGPIRGPSCIMYMYLGYNITYII